MIFWQIIKRELQIAMRKQAEILNPLWFFLIVITLFPLVIGPDPKLLSHWLLTGLPLILLSPVAALLLSLERAIWWALVLTLLLGTPVLSCLGAIGVAITVGLRKGGVLLSLLVVPLFIPVLIFSASVLDAAALNLPYGGQLAILGAILAAVVTLSPFAIATALRISLDQ